jgi:hypothetical protein
MRHQHRPEEIGFKPMRFCCDQAYPALEINFRESCEGSRLLNIRPCSTLLQRWVSTLAGDRLVFRKLASGLSDRKCWERANPDSARVRLTLTTDTRLERLRSRWLKTYCKAVPQGQPFALSRRTNAGQKCLPALFSFGKFLPKRHPVRLARHAARHKRAERPCLTPHSGVSPWTESIKKSWRPQQDSNLRPAA